jgi:2-methylisocitrate lyase-like PEP mutase family enzyme
MTDRFKEFHQLHHGDRPLLLPNAWDHASAAALAARGFTAIGTTSLGVAAAAGKPDGTGDSRDETMALARGIVRLPAMISVDMEGGFSDSPQQVGALAAELEQAGVVGINIEDGRPDGSLTSVRHLCEVIAAVRQAAPRLFVNARTDAYWVGVGNPGVVAIERAQAYQQAGASGIFVPGVEDEEAISTLVKELSVPLNILLLPAGPTYARLSELGVGRVSCGSVLFRLAVHSAVEFAWAVAHDGESRSDLPSYAQIQALALDFKGERGTA